MLKQMCLSLLAFSCLVLLAQTSEAQVVPYRVDAVVTGNLNTGAGAGAGNGLHLGQFSFTIDESGLDVQTAADGSELWLMKVQDLAIEITPAGDGLVELYYVNEWEIIGGTGRFENASAVDGNIISTLYSEPFDPSDLTNITGYFQKVGKINLGKKGKKK